MAHRVDAKYNGTVADGRYREDGAGLDQAGGRGQRIPHRPVPPSEEGAVRRRTGRGRSNRRARAGFLPRRAVRRPTRGSLARSQPARRPAMSNASGATVDGPGGPGSGRRRSSRTACRDRSEECVRTGRIEGKPRWAECRVAGREPVDQVRPPSPAHEASRLAIRPGPAM